MPKWYSKESANMVEAERNHHTSTRTGGTSAPKASPPETPPAPPGDAEGNESYQVEGMPSSCVYMHSPFLNTQLSNHNAFPKDAKSDNDFIPDLLITPSAVWKYR
jgi:hypothetical protein